MASQKCCTVISVELPVCRLVEREGDVARVGEPTAFGAGHLKKRLAAHRPVPITRGGVRPATGNRLKLVKI